jgi:predicted CopG family antitoxin
MAILSPTCISAALIVTILIFQSVTPWWQGVIIAIVGAPLAALIALWFNAWQHKRTRQAEMEKTGDQSYAELGHVVLELTDKERGRLEESIERVTVRLEEIHQKELQFLQEQLRHRGNLEVQARNRTHAALAEVQRCVMAIRAHEEIMRNGELPFAPFVFKTYEEIIGVDKIPTIVESADGS